MEIMPKKLIDRKSHWEEIYQSKEINELSWIQQTPETSLNFIKQFNLSKTAKIIDIGSGDSFFVDHLLGLGFEDITILDISETALEKVKKRLGGNATRVKWIVGDAATFKPEEKYDFWRDRAAFHFLTADKEIENYINTIQEHMKQDGLLLIGTFSEQGPKRCCGLDIKQYSETTMTKLLKKYFEKIKCISVDHKTPADVIQNYIFCGFRKLALT